MRVEATPTRLKAAKSAPRTILRAVATGLSAGLLLLVAALATLVVVVPAAVGGTSLSVLTGSMQPRLPPGTLVIVKPAEVEEIGVGDVITYQLRSGEPVLVTHRVVAREVDTRGETRFITQGDANDVPDPAAVLPVQVRGVVWYAVPGVGWVNTVVNGELRQLIVPIVAFALFGYAGWTVLSTIRARKAADSE